MHQRLFVSFWHFSFDNIPLGTFRKRLLQVDEARALINASRESNSLLWVAEDDLIAPYNEDARGLHEKLCAALGEHCSIGVQLSDFIGEDFAHPLSMVEIDASASLLVVDCSFEMDSSVRGTLETVVSKDALAMSVAGNSIAFYLIEKVD